MITRKVSRWIALAWPERRVVTGVALLLPLIWAGLRMFGFSRMHEWARRPTSPAAGRPDLEPDALGALVEMAGRVVPFSSTCLTRSLALVWLLGRRGVRSELRVGVRTSDDGFESHAWVEHQGRPINEIPAVSGRFAVLEGIGGTRPGTRP